MFASSRSARAVAVSLLLLTVTAAHGGGPGANDRRIDALVSVTGRLTYTVTDHGETCGLDADSTATWVLRFDDRVFCSRNDHASQVSYPACADGNDTRCVTGGLDAITEAAQTPEA